MLALVTGAGGFAGGYLTAELLKRGYNVRAMIRRRADSSIPTRLQELKTIYKDKLWIVRGDVTNPSDCYDAMSATDCIFHLASQSFVPDSVDNPSYTFQTNVYGTANILEAAYKLRSFAGKIIFASSSEIYGLQPPEALPLNEQSKPNPRSPYATSKIFAEYLARNYYDLYGVQTVISRAFNHEGVGRGHHFVTASIVRQLVSMKLGELDNLVIGDTFVTRDWSHVQDVVEAYILLAEKGAPGETYVIGSGKQTSVEEFIELTTRLLSLPGVRIKHDESLLRKADVPRLQADATKIKALGWKPKLSLEDIIVEMIAYYMGMTRQQRAQIGYNC
jgi:GDP-mannose 4,6-dehydratase